MTIFAYMSGDDQASLAFTQDSHMSENAKAMAFRKWMANKYKLWYLNPLLIPYGPDAEENFRSWVGNDGEVFGWVSDSPWMQDSSEGPDRFVSFLKHLEGVRASDGHTFKNHEFLQ